MSKPKVYIDGKEGTTGLQIYERLGGREDIELLLIDEDKRKDTEERKKFLNAADLVFLCLPDAAAVEAVALVKNPATRIIDASTAHRTDGGGLGIWLCRTAARPAPAHQVLLPSGQPRVSRHWLFVHGGPPDRAGGAAQGLPLILLLPHRLLWRRKEDDC